MNQKIKILHLEDLPSDAELIARELKKGKINSEILVVDDKKMFEKALIDFSPDIILCDHSLHSFDSHEALRIVKLAGVTVPFILVTATMTDEFAVSIMKDGAYDYIIKDRLNRLPGAVRNSIERHALEAEKQATRERLEFHIENAPLGFIEWDHNGFAKTLSARAEEILGWNAKDFIKTQKTGFSQVFEEDFTWVNKIYEQLISGNVERNIVRYRNITKNGEIRWCEWFNSVLKDEEGHVKTILSLVQDITEQKLLEKQRDNFLAMASHELRTPVTTIKAYGQLVEIMLEEKGDPETLGMIKRMGTQVNKITNLINNMLDFGKIQEGKVIYNECFFDFNDLVKEVIEDMQKISTTHKIKNKPGKKETIFGDKDKLSQVLSNLISNAIKYSPKAKKVIVSNQVKDDGVILSVQDFGIGILPADIKNVFEQFYRVNGINQSTFPGMGFGLYICSEIISKAGGKIWVESIINEGSIFHFWLPLDHRNHPHSVADAVSYLPLSTEINAA